MESGTRARLVLVTFGFATLLVLGCGAQGTATEEIDASSSDSSCDHPVRCTPEGCDGSLGQPPAREIRVNIDHTLGLDDCRGECIHWELRLIGPDLTLDYHGSSWNQTLFAPPVDFETAIFSLGEGWHRHTAVAQPWAGQWDQIPGGALHLELTDDGEAISLPIALDSAIVNVGGLVTRPDTACTDTDWWVRLRDPVSKDSAYLRIADDGSFGDIVLTGEYDVHLIQEYSAECAGDDDPRVLLSYPRRFNVGRRIIDSENPTLMIDLAAAEVDSEERDDDDRASETDVSAEDGVRLDFWLQRRSRSGVIRLRNASDGVVANEIDVTQPLSKRRLSSTIQLAHGRYDIFWEQVPDFLESLAAAPESERDCSPATRERQLATVHVTEDSRSFSIDIDLGDADVNIPYMVDWNAILPYHQLVFIDDCGNGYVSTWNGYDPVDQQSEVGVYLPTGNYEAYVALQQPEREFGDRTRYPLGCVRVEKPSGQ